MTVTREAGPLLKKCATCKKKWSVKDFEKRTGAGDGYRPHCRKCRGLPSRTDPTPGKRNVKNPLEEAYKKDAAERVKREALEQFKALLEENKKLKIEMGKVTAIGTPQTRLIANTSAPHSEAVACALLSDVHCEEPVDPESVNGLNEYSPKICQARIENFFRNLLRLTDICARDSKITVLWLGILGDLLTNYLHEENQEMNELPPSEAAELIQNLIASGIEFLIANSKYKIIIDCVAGNHGRMTKKPRNGNHSGTSIETFLYVNLAKFFRHEPRVEIRVARSKMLYRKFFESFNMRIIHGDDIGYQGGIGGITIPIRKKIAAWDKSIRASLTVMGHFHQRLDGGDHMVNGSVIGYNAYAQGLGASPEPPSQQFFLIHSRDGGVKSITAPIFLEDRK